MEQRCVGSWVLEGELGRGSFAVVWRARHSSTGTPAAVKEINTDKLNKKLQESLASEVAVLSQIKHKNVVGLLDLLKDGSRIYIVLEYCAGGDLGLYIRRYGRVSEATARYFLVQLAEGLKELRAHNVIHRDLKPQNLLLSDTSATPLVKIADFGFARSLAPQGLAETLCGSPLYMAPEILQFQKYDAKADLWSVGTILFELLAGRPPYNGANHVHLLRNIERSEARLPDHVAQKLSGGCRALVGQLLNRNPVQRLTFEELFQHAFLTGAGGSEAGDAAGSGSGGGGGPGVSGGQPAAGAGGGAALAQPLRGVPPPSAPRLAPRQPAQPQAPPPTAAAPLGGGAQQAGGLQAGQQQQQLPQSSPLPSALHPQQMPLQPQPPKQEPPQQPPQQALQPVQQHPLQDSQDGAASAGMRLSDSLESDYVVVDCSNSASGTLGHSGAGAGRAPRRSSRLASSDGGGYGSASASGGSSTLVSRAEAVLKGEAQGAVATTAALAAAIMGPQQGGPASLAACGAQRAPGAGGGAARGPFELGLAPEGPLDCDAAAEAPGAGEAAALTASALHDLEARVKKARVLTGLMRALSALLLSHLQQRQHPVAAASPQPHGHKRPHGGPHASMLTASLAAGGAGAESFGAHAAETAGAQQQAKQAALQLLAVQLLDAAFIGLHTEAASRGISGAGAFSNPDAAWPAGQPPCGGPQHLDVCPEASGLLPLLAAAAAPDLAELEAAASELLAVAGASLAASAAAAARDGGGASRHGGGGGGPSGWLPHAAAVGGEDDASCASLGASPLSQPLPNAYGVLYDEALSNCRAAAIEELLGGGAAGGGRGDAAGGAGALYAMAEGVLLFLSLEWRELGAIGPGLSLEERLRLHKLCAAISSRAAAAPAPTGAAIAPARN